MSDNSPQTTPPRTVLAIDPGSVKCGIALVSGMPLKVIARAIVPVQQLVVEVGALLRSHAEISAVIVGSGTKSRVLFKAMRDSFPDAEFIVVDEHGSSMRARQRYCREIPAKGWRKFIPPGMRSPEQSYDDWAAVLLAEEFLQRTSNVSPDSESPRD